MTPSDSPLIAAVRAIMADYYQSRDNAEEAYRGVLRDLQRETEARLTALLTVPVAETVSAVSQTLRIPVTVAPVDPVPVVDSPTPEPESVEFAPLSPLLEEAFEDITRVNAEEPPTTPTMPTMQITPSVRPCTKCGKQTTRHGLCHSCSSARGLAARKAIEASKQWTCEDCPTLITNGRVCLKCRSRRAHQTRRSRQPGTANTASESIPGPIITTHPETAAALQSVAEPLSPALIVPGPLRVPVESIEAAMVAGSKLYRPRRFAVWHDPTGGELYPSREDETQPEGCVLVARCTWEPGGSGQGFYLFRERPGISLIPKAKTPTPKAIMVTEGTEEAGSDD